MKTIIFKTIILFALTTLIFSSCNKNESIITNNEKINSEPEMITPMNSNDFAKSVAIWREGQSSITGISPIIIEINNFNPNYSLNDEVWIDGIGYNDNGTINDLVANDGVFTSIETYSEAERSSFNQDDDINFDSDFLFETELKTYLADKYLGEDPPEAGPGISIGCKVRMVVCPETSWYDTCWPFSSPCWCFEFYDCEASITLDF